MTSVSGRDCSSNAFLHAGLQFALDRAILGLEVSRALSSLDHTFKSDAGQQGLVDGLGGSNAHAQRLKSTSLTASTAQAALAEGSHPVLLQLSVRPFPWPAATEDLGAASAAAFLNLLLVFSFLAPTRGMVLAVVSERELRLREGMKILGEFGT